MNRLSTHKDYIKDTDTFEVPVSSKLKKHIRRVVRIDGTEAIGALTMKGVAILTQEFAPYPCFLEWDIYTLPSGQVYLMEGPF